MRLDVSINALLLIIVNVYFPLFSACAGLFLTDFNVAKHMSLVY